MPIALWMNGFQPLSLSVKVLKLGLGDLYCKVAE